MNEIIIDKNVPIPNHGFGSKYPLDALEVGESFVIHKSKRGCISGYMARSRPKKFISRSVPGTDTMRVWRVL